MGLCGYKTMSYDNLGLTIKLFPTWIQRCQICLPFNFHLFPSTLAVTSMLGLLQITDLFFPDHNSVIHPCSKDKTQQSHIGHIAEVLVHGTSGMSYLVMSSYCMQILQGGPSLAGAQLDLVLLVMSSSCPTNSSRESNIILKSQI